MKLALRTLILLLVRLLGWPRIQRAHRQPGENPRILLLRPDHLGDMVLATPVLDALRARLPEAHIAMMVGPWSSAIVERHPALDELISCAFPGFQRASQHPLAPYMLLWKLAGQLRAGNYDVAINLRPDFWWGATLIYLAGIPRRVGYALAPATPFLSHALPFPEHQHSTFYNLELASAGLQALGKSPLETPFTPERYPLRFETAVQERQWVAQRLQNAGIAPEAPIVVIHPGTGGAVKLWRSDAWANCANQLQVSYPTLRFVLTGTPKERPLLDEIAQGIAIQPLCVSDSSVGQLAALLQRASLVMGVDNGPLHLAVTQDVPTIRIFGPTDSRIFGPWGAPTLHRVITSTQRCLGCPGIPCGRLDFTDEELPQRPCVRVVPEESVLALARNILSPTSDAHNTPSRS